MHDRWHVPGEVRLALLGGLASGVAGALLFATAHAIIIVPIWGRMWSGLAWGALAGVAGAWALVELVPAVLTATVVRALALGAGFGGLLWVLVAPVTLVDAVLRRLGVQESTELIEVAVAVTLAIGSGAAFAWWRSRRWRATIAGAAATLVLTISMAGPVPIARSQRALMIFLSVLPVAILAGAVLATIVRYLSSRAAARELVSVTHGQP